ncbi:MAG TPA: PDZ domain-containing protein [Thermoanaerobaculia bacterium]|jgi:predicted metalloprotease with PDZ domain
MKSFAIPALLIAILLATGTAIGGDGQKCPATPHECELQIRDMMKGRRYLGLTVTQAHPGLVVLVVRGDGPAARAGFKAGDKLIAINGVPLDNATIADFKKVLAAARPTGKLFVIVQRRASFRKIEVRMEPFSKQQLDKAVAAHLSESHNMATAGGTQP